MGYEILNNWSVLEKYQWVMNRDIAYSRGFEFYAFYKHVYCYFEYTPEYTRKDGVEPPFISTGPGVRACSSPMPSAITKRTEPGIYGYHVRFCRFYGKSHRIL